MSIKMKMSNLEKILNQPAYWVEGINGMLYHSIVEYMETNNLNNKQLAEVFGISKGRVSQILNDGEINFTIEKLIEISLKIGKFPIFKMEDSQEYINKLTETNKLKKIKLSNIYQFSNFLPEGESEGKKIKIGQFTEYKIAG